MSNFRNLGNFNSFISYGQKEGQLGAWDLSLKIFCDFNKFNYNIELLETDIYINKHHIKHPKVKLGGNRAFFRDTCN